MTKTLADVAAELGFNLVTEPDASLKIGLQQLYGESSRLTIYDAMERQFEGSRLVVANIESRGANARGVGGRETVLYFAQQDLKLPTLLLQPKGTFGALAGSLLGLVGGRVTFDGDPEFNNDFLILTAHPEIVRELFTPDLRSCLRDHPELTVLAGGARVAVRRAGQVVPPESLAQFIDETNDVVAMITDRGHELVELGMVPPEDAAVAMRARGGLPALISRNLMVSSEELEQFLQQEPPRTIPPVLRRNRAGCLSLLLYVWGGGFFLLGLLMFAVSLLAKNIPWTARVGISLFPLVGLAVIVITYLLRRTTIHLLRAGTCCPARVTDIVSTNVRVNRQRRYKVTFEFEHEGVTRTATTHEYEPAVSLATTLMDTRQSTRLLVDPATTNRVLWIDVLAAK